VNGQVPPSSVDPDVRDLIGAYVLDALDDVERRKVEQLVAGDPEAAREHASLSATAALLGAAVAAAPPTELRSQVLDEITHTSQFGPRTSTAARPRALRFGLTRRNTWLVVAATALVAAAVPGTLAWQQALQTQRVEQQAQSVVELLSAPGAQLVRGDVAGGGTAIAVLASDRALFSATGLKTPASGRAYQLWLLRDGRPIPDAVMTESAGRVRALTHAFVAGDSLAVTIEPTGGSQSPTSEAVVVLKPA
jgi:anti-sigma-K factor RskA